MALRSVPSRGSVGSAIGIRLLVTLGDVTRTADPTLPRDGTDLLATVLFIRFACAMLRDFICAPNNEGARE